MKKTNTRKILNQKENMKKNEFEENPETKRECEKNKNEKNLEPKKENRKKIHKKNKNCINDVENKASISNKTRPLFHFHSVFLLAHCQII